MTGVQTCALRSEEHTSELQSHDNLVCRLLLEKTENACCPAHPPGGPPAARPAAAARAVGVGGRTRGGGGSGRWAQGGKRAELFFFFKDWGAHGVFPFSPPRPSPV